MKPSTILATLSIAAGASAQLARAGLSIQKRQVQDIIDVVGSIQEQVEALNSAIDSYSGGDPSDVLAASEAVNSATASGVETVNGVSEISTTDALQLQPAVEDLTDAVESTIDNLISKREDIIAAGEGETTHSQLQAQLSGAQDLSDAISSKVPEALQELAATLSSGITDAIQEGIDAFEGTGGSSGGDSSESASATAPATSAAATTASATASDDSEDSAPTATEAATESMDDGAMPTETEDADAAPTADYPSEEPPAYSSAAPPEYTGAASLNKIEGYGLAALLAAALAV